jgi:hypothetical protein
LKNTEHCVEVHWRFGDYCAAIRLYGVDLIQFQAASVPIPLTESNARV